MQVTIYADRAEEVSRRSLAAFYRVLAYTLTHELGHVILRSSAHEKSGLMKGVWSKRTGKEQPWPSSRSRPIKGDA